MRGRAVPVLVALWVLFLILPICIHAQISCGDKPPGPPKRIAGGEGFPPLPLPVTPLRRTERKRPPAPPTLLAKVNYEKTRIQHQGRQVYDWVTPSGDMNRLFNQARQDLKVNYKADVVRPDQFDYAPERVPIMYFTGQHAVQLDAAMRNRLRQYVLDGGAILGAAGGGSTEFAESFVKEMREIFPDRPWHTIPLDHPVYRSFYPISQVQIKTSANDPAPLPPRLQGLNIGCRTAIIFSPDDLSCGWDNHTHDEGIRVMPADAKKLGINILAYQLAYYRLGRTVSTPVIFKDIGDTTEEVQIAQLMHDGDWDPSPSSLQFILKAASDETSAFMNYQRIALNPEDGQLVDYPLAFLTGHLDFHFSPKAVENLRQYLENGGTLIVSNCCNRSEFDRAVRREMAAIFPQHQFETLTADHPVYTVHFDLAGATAKRLGLEAITLNHSARVIYSPHSISTAWDREPRPYEQLPDPVEARKEGVNLLVYAMTN